MSATANTNHRLAQLLAENARLRARIHELEQTGGKCAGCDGTGEICEACMQPRDHCECVDGPQLTHCPLCCGRE